MNCFVPLLHSRSSARAFTLSAVSAAAVFLGACTVPGGSRSTTSTASALEVAVQPGAPRLPEAFENHGAEPLLAKEKELSSDSQRTWQLGFGRYAWAINIRQEGQTLVGTAIDPHGLRSEIRGQGLSFAAAPGAGLGALSVDAWSKRDGSVVIRAQSTGLGQANRAYFRFVKGRLTGALAESEFEGPGEHGSSGNREIAF